jgi:acetyl esterase/lipase
VLRLRDRHGITGAFRAANIVYGCYDLSMTPSQRLWGERRLPLTTPGLRWFAEQYTPGQTGEQRRAPDVSPLYADLRGLPPALFSVAALDPLLDDSLFLSARWRAAGNDMVTMVTFLSPAIRRMSAGSLVMTEIRSADADWTTAPMCASATETCAACRILAAALA